MKSEKEIQEYLRGLSDETIIKYYSDVEWTPFPVLLIKEYQRRFEAKSRKDMLDVIKTQAKFARDKSSEMGRLARKKGIKLHDIAAEKSSEMGDLARKKGVELGDIASKKSKMLGGRLAKTQKKIRRHVKGITESSLESLELLEKLAELRRAKVITEKEFQEKKKIILDRI